MFETLFTSMPSGMRQYVPLGPLTTLGIGGPAEYFYEASSFDKLREAVLWARNNNLPITLLGGGSNVLIADQGIAGLVVRVAIRGIDFEESADGTVLVRAKAGEPWSALIESVIERGLWGLENLSGIPGTVGSAPIQNINAYGVSVGDVIAQVVAYDSRKNETILMQSDECAFAYRDSFFKTEEGRELIIMEVVFRLSRERATHTAYRSASQNIVRQLAADNITNPSPGDMHRAILTIRRNIGMLEGIFQSAGSFFKNTVVTQEQYSHISARVESRHQEKNERFSPWHWELPDGTVKISTAFLMECTPYNKTDFRGKKYNGTVGISSLHTLSIINCGGARARDVQAFVAEIKNSIETEFGISIEEEVRFLS